MLLWYGPNGDDTTDDGGERLVCANKCKRGSEEVVSLFGPFQIRKGAVIVSLYICHNVYVDLLEVIG